MYGLFQFVFVMDTGIVLWQVVLVDVESIWQDFFTTVHGKLRIDVDVGLELCEILVYFDFDGLQFGLVSTDCRTGRLASVCIKECVV
jgi:hypothetical protein